MFKNYLVVIPAHNEEAVISAVIFEVLKQGFPCLVIDDASQDGTAEKALRCGVEVIKHPVRLGAWLAVQTGMKYALKKGFAGLISLDADGQHIPGHIQDLLQPIVLQKADVVIGACPARLSLQRRLTGSFFRLLTGVPVKDITSGFRVYNRKALYFLVSHPHLLLDYQDLGVLIALHKAGFRLKEVPVPMRPRQHGKSRIFYSWWEVIRYLAHTGLLGLAKQVRRPGRS